MKGGYNIDPLDLMQIGTVVYMHKLKTWDSSKGAKMITYYYRDMRTKMQRFIMYNAFQIRQGSVFIQNLAYNVSKVVRRYLQETGSNPTYAQISKELSVTVETLKYCERVTTLSIVSWDDVGNLYKASTIDDSYATVGMSPITSIVAALNKRIKGDDASFIELLTCLDEKKRLSDELLFKLKET